MLAFTSAQEMLQTTVQLKTPPLPPLILTPMFCIYTPPRSMKFGPHVGNRCMYHLVYFLYCFLAVLVYTNCRNRDTGACANSYCRGRVACGSVVRKSKPSRSGRCAHVASTCMHHAATKHSPNCTNNTSAQGHTTPPPEMHAHVLTRTYTRPLTMRSRWLFRSVKGASMLAE